MSPNVDTRAQRTAPRTSVAARLSGDDQLVLVLQGGGALGAFQAGVYHALDEVGAEPDWVIGTSIGAINAALIAGNKPSDRIDALQEFWGRMARQPAWHGWPIWPQISQSMAYMQTLAQGIPGFFTPNPMAFLGPHVPLGADHAGYYSTSALETTLNDLVDFSLINRGTPRLTVGAAHVRTSQMRYFDSRETQISAKHIMASGALPPAFPAVRIDGELYWDGGILSNTPTEVIFDEPHRRNSLILAVHMWNPVGPEPQTMWDVLHRQKDIQYSSRVTTHVTRQAQIHRMRHVIRELTQHLPDALKSREDVRALTSYGCPSRMHVVRLLWPGQDDEDHRKDIDFSPSGVRGRWQSGYEKTMRAISSAPWRRDDDPLEGVFLHEIAEDEGSAVVANTIAGVAPIATSHSNW